MSIGRKKIGIAFVVAAVAFGALLVWLYAEQLDDEHEALVADQVEVVKAARNIHSGVPLTKDRITTEKVPRKFLPPNPLLESELNIYLGTPVAVNVEEGAMILTSDFSVSEVDRYSAPLVSPLVIKTAFLRIEADKPATLSRKALTAVATASGYIVESDLHVTRTDQNFSMKARVPAAKFEKFVNEMSGLGVPVERRIRGAGVSADVVKLEKKIGNSEFLIEGLRHAKSKAQKKVRKVDTIEIIAGDRGDSTYRSTTTHVDDSAAKEAAAEVARAEFDKAELEDELLHLHAETALATVELVIVRPREKVELPPKQTFHDELSAEFRESSRALMKACFGTIRLFASALPLLVVTSPGLLGLAFWWRRRRRREADAVT